MKPSLTAAILCFLSLISTGANGSILFFPRSASCPSPLGSPSVVIVSGPGTGTLSPRCGGFRLQLSGTSAATTINITNALGTTALTEIVTDSAIGTIDITNANLNGVGNFGGDITALKLGTITKSTLTLSGTSNFKLTAAAVSDSKVYATAAQVSFSVTSWTSSSPGQSLIQAMSLGTSTSAGEFNSNLFLTGAAVGYTFGSLSVTGAVTGGLWIVHGRANSLSVSTTSVNWKFNITLPMVQIVATSTLSGKISVGGLQLFKANGGLLNLRLLVGANLGDDAELGGSGANADTFAAGTIDRVQVAGNITDTLIYSSTDPTNSILGDGNDVMLGTVAQRLQELTLGGQFFGASKVVAFQFPASVTVGGVSVDPATVPQLYTTPP